jgi:UDP-N-acetylmuramyl pentapeptide phosphotransferase/UDP-N-acetylglucosamine-1-phosphate transferase
MFSGIIAAVLLMVPFTGLNSSFQYIFAALMVMFFVGVKDDLVNMPPFKKFLGQMLAAVILVFKGGFVIDNMYGILGISQLPPFAAWFLSVITIIVVINAFNLIDGVDGLASMIVLVSSLLFAIFFGINGDYAFGCLAASVAGAVGAFLIFNYQPARIFMGDTGSLMLGLLMSVLVIRFISTANSAPILSIGAAPVVGFAILFVPLFDTFRVFSWRMLQGTSPFTPDRNHIHHVLLRHGLSHSSVALSLAAANLAFALLAFSMQKVDNNLAFVVLHLLAFAIVGYFSYVQMRRRVRGINETVGTITYVRKSKAASSATLVDEVAAPARKN